MLKRVAFTMYPAHDLDRARRFYEENLHLKTGLTEDHEGQPMWVEFDLPGGGCFALAAAKIVETEPSPNSGGTIAFEVEDLDQLIENLKAKGVEFVSDMIKSPVCRMIVALDSEGNSFMLHQLKTPR